MDDDEHLAATARAWLETGRGEALLPALGRLLEALERERQVNSPEARREAEDAALKADAALAEASGSAALRRRRMLAELVEGEDLQHPDDRDYRKRIEQVLRDSTPKGRNTLRRMTSRLVYDQAGLVGAGFACHVGAHMRESVAGRVGLMDVEPKQGVDRKSAEAFDLQTRIVGATGYTIGVELRKSRVPPAFWARAARMHNRLAAQMQTESVKIAPVMAQTIRIWCTRQGEWRDIYEMNLAEGRRAVAASAIDETRLLRARDRRK